MAYRPLSLLIALCICSVAQAGDVSDVQTLEQQRAAFRTGHAEAELGNWLPVAQDEEILKDYVLWPDLRATYLKASLKNGNDAEISAFLNRYGVLKPARELRYQYALHLARENRLPEYLQLYQQYYQGLEIANLDCMALQAEIESGHENRVTKRAQGLWLVGSSQADECDPVFEHLRDRNLLPDQFYVERFNLAIDSRRFSLARFLARSLNPRYLEVADEWLSAQNHPAEFVAAFAEYRDTDLTRQLFAYAVERLAVNDPIAASKHWKKLASHFSYDTAQIGNVSRHIALWAARAHLEEANEMLASLPDGARDVESRKWLVRAQLRQRNWAMVADSIDALPGNEAQKEEWQYWKAVALQETGRDIEAVAMFTQLADERSYYGFLAADAINSPYAFTEKVAQHDQEIAQAIASRPEFVRARELFFVGLEGRGRSEWDSAVRLMSSDEQVQAALLADSWGWHSRAISTVASAGEFDDLRVRYPLPWRQVFEKHAGNAGVSNSWAYGIARSESLFMRDIRSSAGAIGVMQLMPETGRHTAREIRMPWSGQATLTDTSSNIQLGTVYLSKMFTRFDKNRVLATAAYNAGPSRVEQWLPDSGSLDARIWIENIPFDETRGYVRRVLKDDAIFHWRITGLQRRISIELPLVAAAGTPGKTVTTD